MAQTTRLQLVIPTTASRNWYTGMNANLTLLDRVTVCARLTNKAGIMLERGDVVVIDTANDEAVKLTTTQNDSTVLGVVFDSTIAEEDAGLVVVTGYCESVKVVTTGGNISPGDKLCTATNQGYAQKAAWGEYAFALALQSASATGAVSAIILTVPENPGALGGMFDLGLFDVHLYG